MEAERGWTHFLFQSVIKTTKTTILFFGLFFPKERKNINPIKTHKEGHIFSVSSRTYLCQSEDYLFLKFPHEFLKVQSREKSSK